jgi:hypothetical protein
MARKTKPAPEVDIASVDLWAFPEDELLSKVTEAIAGAGVPDPSLIIEGLDPLASLWIAHELVQEVLGRWVSGLEAVMPDDEDEQDELNKPIYRLVEAFAALTSACIGAGLLPEEARAEEAAT